VTARALGFALDFIANEIESAADDAVTADYIETLREAIDLRQLSKHAYRLDARSVALREP
jgi:hypothetical protein